jgi:hypothetical protein
MDAKFVMAALMKLMHFLINVFLLLCLIVRLCTYCIFMYLFYVYIFSVCLLSLRLP